MVKVEQNQSRFYGILRAKGPQDTFLSLLRQKLVTCFLSVVAIVNYSLVALADKPVLVDEIVADFGMDSASSRRMEAEPQKLEKILHVTLNKAKENPKSERAKRGQKPVMRLMQSNVDRNRLNIKVWQKRLDEAKTDLASARSSLAQESMLVSGPTETGKNYVTAKKFSEGVTITTNASIPSNVDALPPPAVTISSSLESRTSFLRRDHEIVETRNRDEIG